MTLSLETRVAFDALIVTVVAPELKGRGYRKRGLRWRRSRDNVKAGIRVERQPRVGALDEVRFTFSFEVRTADVSILGRSGALMPDANDVWWHVHAGVLSRSPLLPRLEPALVEHEIADAVSRVGDTIESLTSTAAVRAFADKEAASLQIGLLTLNELGRRRA
jgi:hypothetical protein